MQHQWFHCANIDLGFRGPSCFFFFTCFVAYQFVSFCTLSTILCWRIFQVYPRESCLQLYGNFYLSLVLQKMQVSESVLSILLKTCICTFRDGSTCSLPAPTWTTSSSSSSSLLLLLLLLLLEGWIYFAHVTVRKFTKTTTIWAWILHNFTYFISSDSFCVKYILNYNSIQDFPLCLGCIKHQLPTIRVHWYFQNCMMGQEYGDSLWVASGVKCDKTKAASSQMSYSLLYKCSLWGSIIHTSMSCTKLNNHWNYYKHGWV